MPALNLDYRTATRTLDWRKLNKIEDPREVIARHDWKIEEPQLNWLEGVPLGNGDMASMYFGAPNRMMWLINKGDLWDHRVPGGDSNLPQVPFRQISNWIAEKDWKSINKIEERGKNLTPRHYLSFQPAAWVILEPIGESSFSNYKQSHSMLTGEVTTNWTSDFMASPLAPTKYELQTFLAADQNVLRIRIEADRPLRNIRARLLRPHLQHLPDPIFRHRGTLLELQYTFPDNLFYVVGLESDIPSRLGSQDNTEASIIFDDLDDTSLEVRVVVACSETTSSPEDRVRATLNVEKPQRYRGAIRRNQQAMEKYWYRSGFSWPDHPKIEKFWYLSQYLLGTCSAVGKQAMGLQGLYSGHGFPPWHGGYRTDLHLQMSYWGAFASNRLDMIEPYIRLFALELRDQMRTDTARHWGWGGVKVPLSFGPRGQELSTWLAAKEWPGGTAWVAIDFLKIWEHSSDDIYLTTVAYNFALECAEFLENWLFQDGPEKVTVFPSFCPNMGKGTPEAWVENPPGDIALIKTLFTKLMEISDHAEIREDPKRVERWQYILDHLPDYPMQNGKWADGRNVDFDQPHRYLTKMMAVYPLDEVNLSSSKSDMKTANATLSGLEELGWERAVGFTMIWLAAIHARLGNFTRAIETLETFIDRYARVNGLNSHFPLNGETPSNLFQIDANLGFAGAVNELFLQCTDGVIRLFPGVPKNTTAQFWGWRTCEGHLVAATMEKGKVEAVLIEATRACEVQLLSPFAKTRLSYKIRTKTKSENKTVANKKGKVLSFTLKAGQRLEIGKMILTSPKKTASTDTSEEEEE
ncbi:MAG: glycoside hydrolase N-terminal domain-containing protein [Candidatus Omnitrophica bacterium]|nr:glycoside hydrolase N-terminal domain-containing protein [Candidatus Omnitrophota bacterium]MCB9768808.1 glycoside hydrolase N-terminal domain-containing protein [Candidatus Omnitrophota bacterium]